MSHEIKGRAIDKISIRFYNDHEVRAVWNEEASKWWFSVLDIVGALNQQDDYGKTHNYWKYLKAKLKKDGSELVGATTQMKPQSQVVSVTTQLKPKSALTSDNSSREMFMKVSIIPTITNRRTSTMKHRFSHFLTIYSLLRGPAVGPLYLRSTFAQDPLQNCTNERWIILRSAEFGETRNRVDVKTNRDLRYEKNEG